MAQAANQAMMVELRRQVQQKLAQSGMRQTQLAQLIGLTQGQISKFLNKPDYPLSLPAYLALQDWINGPSSPQGSAIATKSTANAMAATVPTASGAVHDLGPMLKALPELRSHVKDERIQRVLLGLLTGEPFAQIARSLGTSPPEVETIIGIIFRAIFRSVTAKT